MSERKKENRQASLEAQRRRERLERLRRGERETSEAENADEKELENRAQALRIRQFLEFESRRMQTNAVRCSRVDRVRRLRDCEREMTAEGESQHACKLWCELLDFNELMTAVTNGQTEIVACICSLARFTMTDLKLAAFRAFLFGHMDIVNILIAEMGSAAPTINQETFVEELVRTRLDSRSLLYSDSLCMLFQAELVTAVLNRQADVVSALMDTCCVNGQIVTRLERASNKDYLDGVDCALIVAVARGYHDILVRILQRSTGWDARCQDPLPNPLQLGVFGIGTGTLLTLAVMSGHSQVVVTVLKYYRPTEGPVVYECLTLALRYHCVEVMEVLLGALKQKLTCAQSDGIGPAVGDLLPAISLSADALAVMVVDILEAALNKRVREMVVLITERFSCQDLDIAHFDLLRLLRAIHTCCSVPIVRLFICWAHSHIQDMTIDRTLGLTFPTGVNMLLAAGAQMGSLPQGSNLSYHEQRLTSLFSMAVRQVHLHHVPRDEDLVAAVDRLPISNAEKRAMLFRPRYSLAFRRSWEADGSARPPVEEVKPKTAEASRAAAWDWLGENKPAQTAEESAEAEKPAVNGEGEREEEGGGENGTQDQDINEKSTDSEELD